METTRIIMIILCNRIWKDKNILKNQGNEIFYRERKLERYLKSTKQNVKERQLNKQEIKRKYIK